MDMSDIWTSVAVIRGIPASAAGAAMAAAERAETAAESVESSTSDDLAYILGT